MRRASATFRVVVALLVLAARARAEDEEPNSDAVEASIPDFVEKLPEPVQNVVQNMAESRDPPDRFMYSLLGLPRARFGSGTTWLPDASPLYAVIPHKNRWGILVHGNLYTGYNWFGSKRGGQRFMGRNTLVVAPFRTFRKSELSARLAISFEPFTIGNRGYPLILQAVQEKDGDWMYDKQYALDLFRELAVTWSWEVTRHWAATIYAAAAGEPALGPVTFTQRISASADPLAPLGFQVQEASHASFGVLTVGAFTRDIKLEASWFNGEVPGNKRYGLYLRRPDSYSVRFTYNPMRAWSAQVSYGFLERPVPEQPDRSDHKFSTSIAYTEWYGADAGFATTLSAAERVTTRGERSGAVLLEGYWNVDGHHALFGRAEVVQRTGIELALSSKTEGRYPVGTLAGGYVYYFGPLVSLAPGLGVRASMSPMAKALEPEYGTRLPLGVMVFAQLRTAALPIGS